MHKLRPLRSGAMLLVGLAILLTFGAGTAQAQEGGERAKLTVDVSAQRFSVQGDQVVARGPVTAKVTRENGTTEMLTQEVALRVKGTSNCRILDLSLAKLYLNLLGLEVRTSDINVKITGDAKQTLGKLFCSLSEGLKLDKSALLKRTADSLNKALRGQPLPIISLRAPIRVQEQMSSSRPGTKQAEIPPPPPGSCEVLNLLLGPLHLDLLGLVVDLYGPTPSEPIQVLITANPNGGVLGATFCEAAGSPQPA